jgi:hypothetical protein
MSVHYHPENASGVQPFQFLSFIYFTLYVLSLLFILLSAAPFPGRFSPGSFRAQQKTWIWRRVAGRAITDRNTVPTSCTLAQGPLLVGKEWPKIST